MAPTDPTTTTTTTTTATTGAQPAHCTTWWMPHPDTLEGIADSLGVSVVTLHTQCQEANSSYQFPDEA